MGIKKLKIVVAVVVIAVLMAAVGVSILRVRVFPAPQRPHTSSADTLCRLTLEMGSEVALR